MNHNIDSITHLVEKESDFFQEILDEYQFYIQIGNLPDGDWFETLLDKRQKHIDKLKFIFNNKSYKNIFEKEISESVKLNFQKIIAGILALDSQMKELLAGLQNKKSEQLVKIKKVHKLLVPDTEINNTSKIINLSVR